jgi:hypothetical protein
MAGTFNFDGDQRAAILASDFTSGALNNLLEVARPSTDLYFDGIFCEGTDMTHGTFSTDSGESSIF